MRFLTIFVLALQVLSFSSCVHRNFEYDSGQFGYVEVVFDWRNDPDAQPATMSLYLFPRDGGEPQRYEFVGRDGGIIRVLPGVYDAICINSDKRDVFYRNANLFDSFEVTTPEYTTMTFNTMLSVHSSELPGASGTENQRMMMPPPMLWSSSEIGFEITVNSRSKSKYEVDHQVLYMYPKRIVDTYVVTVKNVRNIQYLNSLRGTISDMSDGYLAGPQLRTDTEIRLPFDLGFDPTIGNAEGTFLTFGHCPYVRRSHKLVLYAILTDGSKYYYEFDVSDQAHNPPDENGIYHIVVEFLDIPEPSGGDMSTNVGNWRYVDIYLNM